jgi:hypothetical protein
MLDESQIKDLAKRMDVPLVFCDFKDGLKKTKLQYNKSYIINMENLRDPETGALNQGSHWTCFQCNRYPNGNIEKIYFDSFGQPPPEIVKKFCGSHVPHNDKDVQSLMNSACGWYCLAFLHFINSSEHRCGDLFTDANTFINMFDDLNTHHDHLKNEYMLKHFFRSKDPSKRKRIEVGDGVDPNSIINQDEDQR